MTLAPRRIVLWLALIGTATIWLVLSPSKRHALPPVDDPPWIPLPRSGMDAADPALRELLSSHYAGMYPLAGTCGMHDDATQRERYRLRISRDGWGDYRAIEIVPLGDWLDVSVRDDGPPPAPERRESAKGAFDVTPERPVVHARIRRRDAEPIRRAWDTPALWHAKQASFAGCLDGRHVILEACIDGHYALRHRDCDAAEPARELWGAVTTLLPAPERTHLHER